MTESTSIASSAKVSDAAALSLIDIRRIDRAAGKSSKRGDLTDKLKRRRANGEAPPPSAAATIAPEATPAAAPTVAPAPSLPPLAAFAPETSEPEVSPASPVAAPEDVRQAVAPPESYIASETSPEPEMSPAVPVAAPTAVEPPKPYVASETSPAPEVSPSLPVAAPDLVRHAAALPEPYVAPEPEPSALPAAPEVVRRAVALPEPYFAPEPPPEPEPQPALPAAAYEVTRAAPLPYDDLRSTEDLIYYWDELRAGRELPFFSTLDRTRIAISWPDTVMVNYGADQAAMPQIARLSRLTGVVEFSSMVTDWILSCSRQVARIGKAMETKRAFNGARSARNYHMLLLPFANSGGASDYVLCHLSNAD